MTNPPTGVSIAVRPRGGTVERDMYVPPAGHSLFAPPKISVTRFRQAAQMAHESHTVSDNARAGAFDRDAPLVHVGREPVDHRSLLSTPARGSR